MRFSRMRFALLATFGFTLVSCNDGPAAPERRFVAPSAASLTAAAAAKIVISQVYGGGGNANATKTNDFVELFNAGNASASVEGWSVQYASATGTGNFGVTNQIALLHGSIAPGQYYLVALASGGSAGTALPAADASAGINMAAGAGKVALVDQTASLGCNGSSANPCSDAIKAHIIDLVGFGTGSSGANFFEGTGPTPTLSSTLAAVRKTNGCTDTDNNAADFSTAVPAPRNSASPLAPCDAPPPPPPVAGPLDHVTLAGASSVTANATIALTASLFDAANLAITDNAATFTWTSADPTILLVQSTSANTATLKGVKAGGPVDVTLSVTSKDVTKTVTKQITVNPAPSSISVSAGAGLPLVIGYETGVFASGTDASGNAVFSGNVTWSTSNTAVLVVTDPRGIVRAVGEGSAKVIATAADGSTGSFTITTEVPLYNTSPTARFGHNTEFGVPADADASNDVIIAREQYTLSYNPQRGGPNWVSWDLSATHLGSRNRCNCYSADTALARLGYGQYMYNTAEYTGSGYDRGHMQPSADQTVTDGENARTFFMTNFLPQKHGLNAGPWEDLENELRDSVRAGREAYVIAGGVFTRGVGLGTVNNAGKIAIPDSTWKIVVLMPAGTGLANVTSATDVNVIAVNMPNVDAPGPNDWTAYRTTVGKLQKSTGYDFLAALPDPIECKVEASDCAPTAHITGTAVAGGSEGQSLTLDATTSSDPDAGDVLSYQWSIGGQVVSIQPSFSHVFTDNGSYAVQLIVADRDGKGDTTSVNVSVANVAPSMSFTTSASVNEGDAILLAVGSLSDASSVDAASLHAAVDCGTGAGFVEVPGAGSYSCPTNDDGSRTVRARVTDKDGGVSVYERSVTIANVAPATTLVATTPLSIPSGASVGVTGTFADPGADAPWQYQLAWSNGTPQTGTLATTGASVSGSHQYLAAGQYMVSFTVTDKDGGTSTRTLTVNVARIAIDGQADPGIIKLNDKGNGDISIRLSSSTLDVGSADVESVRIGGVAATRGNIDQGGRRLSVDFSRKALIDAGMLTANTTELVLTATLADGRQVQARVAVDVH